LQVRRDRFARAYGELHGDVQDVFGPDFSVPLHLGEPTLYPAKRNMAFCAYGAGDNGDEIIIFVAPKLLKGPPERIEAILRHELAHAIEFHMGEPELRTWAKSQGKTLPSGMERRADSVAEILWGDPIYYDEILVQTLDRGIRPRPKHLGL
jgi:hypothetical protein